MSPAIGYGCAAFCVALLGYASWASVKGDFSAGMISVGLAFVLLMCALAALRVKSRI